MLHIKTITASQTAMKIKYSPVLNRNYIIVLPRFSLKSVNLFTNVLLCSFIKKHAQHCSKFTSNKMYILRTFDRAFLQSR